MRSVLFLVADHGGVAMESIPVMKGSYSRDEIKFVRGDGAV